MRGIYSNGAEVLSEQTQEEISMEARLSLLAFAIFTIAIKEYV